MSLDGALPSSWVVPRGTGRSSGVRRRAPARSLHLRLALVVLASVAGFHYSLASLADSWQSESPLADLALVPLLALGLAVVAVQRHPFLESVRPGRLDFAVGALCLLMLAVVLVVLPIRLGNYFWMMRLDLLVLPLFAALGITLLVGVRAVLAFLFPLSYLLLAWPLPLMSTLDVVQPVLVVVTSRLVEATLLIVPIGHVVPTGGDLLIRVGGADGFDVAVASACSGVQGVTGFLIVALAAMYVVRGRAVRRIAWLAVGVVAAQLANVVRILLILATGTTGGETLAMQVLHPVGGLLTLNAVVALMCWLLPRFGLSVRRLRPDPTDVPLTQRIDGVPPANRAGLVRRGVLLVLVAGSVAVADGSLAHAAGAFDNEGLPTARPFTPTARIDEEFAVSRLGDFGWARTYFGTNSTWRRYVLRPRDPGGAYTVWVDSIVTDDLGTLRAHPVENCYRFHDFALPVRQNVVLHKGVMGKRFVYVRPDGAQWHTLAWEWPVQTRGGVVRHERVVLFASSERRVSTPTKLVTDLPALPVRSALLQMINGRRPDIDRNKAVTAALVAQANAIIGEHVARSS